MITGRCYCGKSRIAATAEPRVVTYCHCSDCRRASGAPISAFAAFDDAALTVTPEGKPVSPVPGSTRWFCDICGSQLVARYDYLPGQVYVPLGVLDQAADLEPDRHSHAASALPWLHIADDLPRSDASGRDALNAASK